MTVGAIIQARTASTRLPGKVLADIAGAPMLARVVDRARRARTVDRVIVATTTESRDDELARYAGTLAVDVFRGSEDDVLDRYYQAALLYELDVVVRITSDCPLLDPGLIDRVVTLLRDSRADYAANTLERTFPRGLDVQAVPFATLERAWREATSVHERAHVLPYVYERPETFSMAGFTDAVNRSHMRWTVDTEEDLTCVREIYRSLGAQDFAWTDVLKVLESRPELLQINATVRQKTAHEL